MVSGAQRRQRAAIPLSAELGVAHAPIPRSVEALEPRGIHGRSASPATWLVMGSLEMLASTSFSTSCSAVPSSSSPPSFLSSFSWVWTRPPSTSTFWGLIQYYITTACQLPWEAIMEDSVAGALLLIVCTLAVIHTYLASTTSYCLIS